MVKEDIFTSAENTDPINMLIPESLQLSSSLRIITYKFNTWNHHRLQTFD